MKLPPLIPLNGIKLARKTTPGAPAPGVFLFFHEPGRNGWSIVERVQLRRALTTKGGESIKKQLKLRFVEAAKRFWALYWAEMLYSGVLNQDAASEVLSAAALIRSAGLSNDKFEWCMEKIEFAIEELA